MYAQDEIEVWDDVTVNGHEGFVTHIHRNGNGDRICNVRFKDNNLIPPEMEFPDYRLRHTVQIDKYWGNTRRKTYGPIEKYCPECGSVWHETKFNMHVWKDCKKCKKTFEQITKGLK